MIHLELCVLFSIITPMISWLKVSAEAKKLVQCNLLQILHKGNAVQITINKPVALVH